MNKRLSLLVSLLLIGFVSSSCNGGGEVIDPSIKVSGVELTSNKSEIYVGERAELSVNINPSDATNKNYSFIVNPSDLLNIENNVVIALKEGVVDISVITEDGNFKDSLTMNILKNENKVEDKKYLNDLYSSSFLNDQFSTSKDFGLSEENNVGVNKGKLYNEELYPLPTENVKEYIVEDYGISFNGETNTGNLINLLSSLKGVDGNKIVKFKSGTYYFTSSILVDNLKDIYLAGENNTKFVYTGWTSFIVASNCENLHVNNIIFDIDPSPTITGRVFKSEEDLNYGYVYVEVDSRYDLSNQIYNNYKLKKTGSYAEYYYDEDYDSYVPDRSGNLFYNPGLVDLNYDRSTNLLKCTLSKSFWACSYKAPKSGTIVAIAFQVYENHGFYYKNCVNTYMENIEVYTVAGMGLRTNNGKNIYLNRVRFIREENSGRLLTCTADILHTCNLEGEAFFTNCILEGSHDDAINVKSFYTKITQIKNNVVTVQQTQTEVNIGFDVGDEVDIYDPSTMGYKGTYIVRNVLQIGSNFDLTLDRNVPSRGSNNYTGYNLGNATKTVSISLLNSVIKNKRNRGILLQGRNSTIANCSFENVNMGAIQVLSVGDVFKEAIVPYNINIYNNKFLKCYDELQIFTYGDNGPSSAQNGTLQKVDVYNNFFYKGHGNTIYLLGVGNIKIHNNLDYEFNSKEYTCSVDHGDDIYINDNVSYFDSDRDSYSYVYDKNTNNNVVLQNNQIKGVIK